MVTISPIFGNGEFYHVFNRGVARQPIFLKKIDYKQAFLTFSYYRFVKPQVKLSRFKEFSLKEKIAYLAQANKSSTKLVDIVCYVFMPNHFHFLLKQNVDNGISIFMSNFANSYTRYLNTKYDREGPVFQGVFKSVHIESEEQLLHVSRYIHLNPLVSYIVNEKNFLLYPWSSLPEYIIGKSSLFDVAPILNTFSSTQTYKDFVLDQIDYARSIKLSKHLLMDDE